MPIHLVQHLQTIIWSIVMDGRSTSSISGVIYFSAKSGVIQTDIIRINCNWTVNGAYKLRYYVVLTALDYISIHKE